MESAGGGKSHSQPSFITKPQKNRQLSLLCTFMFATLVPRAFFIQAMRSSACSWVRRSEAAEAERGKRGKSQKEDGGSCALTQCRHQGGADLACGPQTSPPCSDPPRCPSPPRSSSFCRTPGGAAGSARRTARSRTAPTEDRRRTSNWSPLMGGGDF